jgi:DinB superfamily
VKYAALIDEFAAGAGLVRDAVKGMTREQLLARPVPGKWSTHEVVCHLADFEIVGAERIKRVIAEENPKLFDADETVFARRLAYGSRELEVELQVIGSIRAQVARILRTLADEDFARVGTHSSAGPLTLQQFVERGANHIKHHVKFIAEKRKALGV